MRRLANFLGLSLLMMAANSQAATLSMSFVDSSGYSIYASSMGGSTPVYGVAYYKVKDIRFQGNGEYSVALAGEGLTPDFAIKVSQVDIATVKIDDLVRAKTEIYGVVFEDLRSLSKLAMLIQPVWLNDIRARMVS
ncbi:hypothetical protein [Aquitalea sp. LB_tupeE]|uniref:hypothetical protein n=1 Tax=Aquitalea sp. LB_tupeE TaxID=2748078 RepID=UPI0015BC684D|nr:hypothetical protein [Aquitalea sp. LB_tupeE]NWK78966.1 hypothetical protein [Aquitalea sp. LB_tupeE]